MSANDWERQMTEMLTAIEDQSTLYLRNIKRCFELSGGSMDEDFRKYFLRKSNQRLEASYANVTREQNWYNEQRGSSERQRSNRGFANETSAQVRNSNPTKGTSENDLNLQPNPTEGDSNANTLDLVVKNEPQSNDFNATESSNNSNENSPNVVINSGNNGSENEDIQIKEESNVEVKEEPADEDVPMRKFMASEVDSNDRPSSIDNDTNLNSTESLLESRSKQKNSGSNAPKPSCSTVTKRFKCQQCKYAAAYKCRLNQHMRKHTGEKLFRCDRCSKRYTNNKNLRSHMTTHKDVFQLHCAGCFRGFSQENEKTNHEKSCGNRRYECHLCKGFPTTKKTALKTHMLKHTGERPFRCNRCSKSYKRLRQLKVHMATHKNRKLPFYCIGCFRRFATKGQKLTHENECRNRRYECHLCKAFVTINKTDLRMHMRRHTGEKPFRCEICMKCFTSKSNLKTHLNIIHNGS